MIQYKNKITGVIVSYEENKGSNYFSDKNDRLIHRSFVENDEQWKKIEKCILKVGERFVHSYNYLQTYIFYIESIEDVVVTVAWNDGNVTYSVKDVNTNIKEGTWIKLNDLVDIENIAVNFAKWIADSKLHGENKQLHEAMIRNKVGSVNELFKIFSNQNDEKL